MLVKSALLVCVEIRGHVTGQADGQHSGGRLLRRRYQVTTLDR
jgi:hypothetical protein